MFDLLKGVLQDNLKVMLCDLIIRVAQQYKESLIKGKEQPTSPLDTINKFRKINHR